MFLFLVLSLHFSQFFIFAYNFLFFLVFLSHFQLITYKSAYAML